MKKSKVTGLILLVFLAAALMGMPSFAKTKTVKMKSGNARYTYEGVDNGETYIFHKFKVGQTGVLRVTGYELTKKNKKSGFTVTLCNKNKKRLDAVKYNYVNYEKGKILYYTLAKGTYYIRLRGKSLKDGSRYKLEARFTRMGSVAGQTGTTKETAENLSKDKPSYVIITASDTGYASKWLSFYTDGKDPVVLTMIPQLQKSNQGTFKAMLFGPSYKDYEKEGKVLKISAGGDRYKLSTTVITKNGTVETKKTTGLKKGYYYLEIYRDPKENDNLKYGNGYLKVTRR